ncbi:hypothetical protein TWF132_010995, partial [Orbilia oligospora]
MAVLALPDPRLVNSPSSVRSHQTAGTMGFREIVCNFACNGVGLGQESRARSIANIQTSRQPPIPATLVSRSLSHQTSSSGPWPWEDDDDPVGVNGLVPSVPSSASSQPLASLSSSSTSTVDDDDDDDDDDDGDNGDRR